MRRRTLGSKKLVDKEIRFTSSTSWTIPAGCKSIDIFLVGGGGAGGNWVTWGYTPGGPGSGGGTNTVKNISVISGQSVSISIGAGGSGNGSGAGSGYTKTFKKDSIGVKQGNQVSVVPGQSIEIIVGKGGEGLYYGYPDTGGYSQFMNSNYRANGGNPSGNGLLNGENSTGGPYTGGNGGSGGSVD